MGPLARAAPATPAQASAAARPTSAGRPSRLAPPAVMPRGPAMRYLEPSPRPASPLLPLRAPCNRQVTLVRPVQRHQHFASRSEETTPARLDYPKIALCLSDVIRPLSRLGT